MIKTRRPRKSAWRRRGRDVAVPLLRRAVKLNVLPLPGTLLTETCPPISSVSCLEMASPSPVPPYLRVVEASACSNAWNRRSICVSVMPMPVSLTENSTSWQSALSSSTRASTATSPISVNLTALLQKLIRICPSRKGSPRKWVDTAGSTSKISSSPLAEAFSDIRFPTFSSTLSRSKSMFSIDSLPASIFEKSRMSLMMPRRCWPELLIFCT